MNTSLFVSRFACSLGLLSLLACGDKAEAPAAAGPAGASSSTSAASSAAAPAAPMAPVTVTTVPARKRDLPVLLKASGIVTPLTSVDVKPQLSSMVAKVHIQDGQFVKAGDLLITLDSRTDEANVAKARAQLAKDNAALADAQRQLARATTAGAKIHPQARSTPPRHWSTRRAPPCWRIRPPSMPPGSPCPMRASRRRSRPRGRRQRRRAAPCSQPEPAGDHHLRSIRSRWPSACRNATCPTPWRHWAMAAPWCSHAPDGAGSFNDG
jgi:pyruvate/2-oxoglutarate dehydrogenase complex dihydrolipoamide acyltransferase (E2) component